MTSRIVFCLGSSRSSRRSATVTSSQSEASRAASIASSDAYLPVPTKRRERSSTPATTSGSACVIVCTKASLRAALEVLLQQQRLIAAVRQSFDRVVHREPQQLVHLDAWPEAPAPHLHDPVARDLVAASPIDVRGASERPSELAAQSRLFAHLAQGAVLGRFVRLDLSLGKGPVVVLRPVDDGDLGLARFRPAHHNAARGSDHV